MPDVLTGGKTQRKALPSGDERAKLAGKLAAGTATDADKARFRRLAKDV